MADFASLLAPILGFAGQVGGAIPGMMKGPQDRELRAQQAGGGAGDQAARETGTATARAGVGAASSGAGATKGLALREALRQGAAATKQGAAQAGRIAAQESNAATQSLRQNQNARRQAAFQFGTMLGGGLASFGAASAIQSKKDVTSVEDQAALAPAAAAAQGDIDPATGLARQQPALTQAPAAVPAATNIPGVEPPAATPNAGIPGTAPQQAATAVTGDPGAPEFSPSTPPPPPGTPEYQLWMANMMQFMTTQLQGAMPPGPGQK